MNTNGPSDKKASEGAARVTTPTWERLVQAAEHLGLLPPYKQEIITEARKRGLISAALPRDDVALMSHIYPRRVDEFLRRVH